MKPFTQTNLEPGNCWQTCVACILEVDPAELPPQEEYDLREKQPDGSWKWIAGPSYHNTLQRYLRKHHGLAYFEIHAPAEVYSFLNVKSGQYHMITGNTVRTPLNGSRHVVVGMDGSTYWDPHPSRAGLTDELKWAFLIPYPKEWNPAVLEKDPCRCPACLVSV